MFRRMKKVEEPAPVTRVGGKGHPTPTRKEAQAAAKQRALGGADPKATSKEQRAARAAAGARMRQGMRNGEEKYLPERDKGPVRRFIRDWIDSRLTIIEMLLPALVIVMVMSLSKSRDTLTIANTLDTFLWVMVILEVTWLSIRLKRELAKRFPGKPTKGWWFYAIMRAIQLRPLRMPKPRVKMFGALPEDYDR